MEKLALVRVDAVAAGMPMDKVDARGSANRPNEPAVRRAFNAVKDFPGSKLQAVIAQLAAVRSDEPAAKFLIFTAFDKTRERIEAILHKEKVSVAHIAKHSSPGSQAGQLQKFNTDPECTVLLLDLQVASVGLNLTSANHILFVDQPTSLTQQKQAVGRCYRFGQGRPVTVWSCIVQQTIEATMANAAAENGRSRKRTEEL